jgi:hypothetical protein
MAGGWALAVGLSWVRGASASDEVVAPGQKAQRAEQEQQRKAAETATSDQGRADEAEAESGWPMHPWEAKPLEVEVLGAPLLREEERIGDYGQPRWTARRRFPTTRVYVVPRGEIELEWWLRYTAPFDDPYESRAIRTDLELSMGLGYRLQLDLYLEGEQKGPEGAYGITAEKVELRWAWADWGELWGNPTIYLEWIHRNEAPDKLEGKLLLGGPIAKGWHSGVNVVYERVLGGDKAGEIVLSAGVSRTVVDSVVSLGLEGKVALVDVEGSRFDFVEQQYLLGPSLSWSPVPPANVLVTPLFGVRREEEKNKGVLEAWLVTGWAF